MKLRAKEVSLVAAGANRRKMALLKSAKGAQMPDQTPEEIRDVVRKAVASVEGSTLKAIVEHVIAKADADGRTLSPRAAGVIKAIGRLLAPHAGEIQSADIMEACKAAGLDNKAVAEVLGKSAADDEDEDEEEIEVVQSEDDGDDADEEDDEDEDEEEEDEAQTAKKAANVVPVSPLHESKQPEPVAVEASAETKEPKGGSVAKSAQAPIEKAADLEDLRKSNSDLRLEVAELRKAAKEAEEMRKAEKAAFELGELKKTVSESYGHLNLDADLVAPALQHLKGMQDKTHYEAMMGVLAKSSEYSRRMEGPAGLFKSIGHSRPGVISASPEDELAEMTKTALQSPENAGKTEQQVYRDLVKSGRGAELRNHARRMARGEV